MSKIMNKNDEEIFNQVKAMLDDEWQKTLVIYYYEGYNKDNKPTIITDICFHNIKRVTVYNVLSASLLINIIDYLFGNDKADFHSSKDNYGINNIKLYNKGKTILDIYYQVSNSPSLPNDYGRLVRIMNNYSQVINAHLPMRKSDKERFLDGLTDDEATTIFDNLSLDEKRKLLSYFSLDKLVKTLGIANIRSGARTRIPDDSRRYFKKNND